MAQKPANIDTHKSSVVNPVKLSCVGCSSSTVIDSRKDAGDTRYKYYVT